MALKYNGDVQTGVPVFTADERDKIKELTIKKEQLENLLELKKRLKEVSSAYDDVIMAVHHNIHKESLVTRICQEVQQLREKHLSEIKESIQKSNDNGTRS